MDNEKYFITEQQMDNKLIKCR